MALGWIFVVLLIIVLLAALLGNRKRVKTEQVGNKSSAKALEILKNRFAKGEIDKQEFEEKKRELENDS